MQEPLQLYFHRNKWMGTKNPNKRLPACYVILHLPTDSVYVGSTNDLSRRCSENLGDLRHNTHKNKQLQGLYNEDPNIAILYEPCEDVDQARFLEQRLVDTFKGSDKLCNVAVEDVTKSTLGTTMSESHRVKFIEANKGRKATEQAKCNMSQAQKNFLQTEAGKRRLEEMVEQCSQKVLYDGVEYPSISEASRQLGVPHTTITRRIKKQDGYL